MGNFLQKLKEKEQDQVINVNENKKEVRKEIKEIISNVEQTPEVKVETKVKVEKVAKEPKKSSQKLIATYLSDEVYNDVIELSKVFEKSRSEIIQICEIEFFKSFNTNNDSNGLSLDNLKPKKESKKGVAKQIIHLVTKDNGEEIKSNANKCGYTKVANYLRDAIDYLLPSLKEKAK